MSNPKRPAALCAAPTVAFVSSKETSATQPLSVTPASILSPTHAKKKAQVDDDPWVPFTVQIRRSTYVALQQAKYWTAGFGDIREHVEKALKPYFAELPGSKTSLPYSEIIKNKKLQF